ncbi:putative Leucine-rich repeat-containing G-protein coupled receptor 5 [Hypsibius exemplaris]|uniref:Leucine-rich repeat-containing G-protein coupled receptor 5 n=1 Tax=Hypsibius exemplaris TaxID=2072580 RepID=A0A1W0WRK3_HYPEX|nr:putative Leucine-rich repeat-containing G-protein coupled receptor 5 [Hypsibius exemplaris]
MELILRIGLVWSIYFLHAAVRTFSIRHQPDGVSEGLHEMPATSSVSFASTHSSANRTGTDGANIMHGPVAKSSSRMPEVSSCPEYCVCSQADADGALLSCNGEHVFPYPELSAFGNVSRLLLENFKKNDLRPADLAGLMATARELRLPRNGIATIRDSLFTGTKSLKRLDLSGNKLSLLTNLTFIGLGSGGLLYLDLSGNRIAAIDPGSFAYLRDLIQLDLNSNKLSQLPNDLFKGLLSLQYLNLEVNQIREIQPHALSHIPRLVHLNLAMNTQLSATSFGLVDFKDLLALQYCDLSHCGLQAVPSNLRSTIRDIRLTGNKLVNITKNSLEKYPALAVLVMDDCAIQHIAPDAFVKLTSLQRLWMNGNGLRGVPLNLPSSLKGLYLDDNNIKLLQGRDMAGLLDMEEIRLQGNQITTIESSTFRGMPHLATLDLRANRLGTLNTALFPPVNSISRLDLSLNPLRTVGRDFLQHLGALKQLEIIRTHAAATVDVPADFFSLLPQLTALDLGGSPALANRLLHEISASPNRSSVLPHLHTLSLRACELTFFETNLEDFFARVPKIKLAQNELACFRENRWLLRLIQHDQKRFYRAQDLKCSTPRHLQGRKVISVSVDTLNDTRVPIPSAALNHNSHFSPGGRQTKHITPSSPVVVVGVADTSRTWIITFIACLFTAAVVSLFFLVVLSCCDAKEARLKRASLCAKLSRFLRRKHDPFPEQMAASNRTLYRSQDDSIFMIGTSESSYPALSPYEELEQRTFRSQLEGIYENDCLSTISTLEIRV